MAKTMGGHCFLVCEPDALVYVVPSASVAGPGTAQPGDRRPEVPAEGLLGAMMGRLVLAPDFPRGPEIIDGESLVAPDRASADPAIDSVRALQRQVREQLGVEHWEGFAPFDATDFDDATTR